MTIFAGGQQPNQKTQVNSTVLQKSFIIVQKTPQLNEMKHRAMPQIINL